MGKIDSKQRYIIYNPEQYQIEVETYDAAQELMALGKKLPHRHCPGCNKSISAKLFDRDCLDTTYKLMLREHCQKHHPFGFMLYEVARIQDFFPIVILHEVRYQPDKLIPRLAMLIMVVSYLDNLIEDAFDRILPDNFSIYELYIHHLHSWISATKSANVISKSKQYLGKDAASLIRGPKILEHAVIRASHSIYNMIVSVTRQMKKTNSCKELDIEKFKQEMEIIMWNSVKSDQYCFIELSRLFKMVVARFVLCIQSRFSDTSCEDEHIVGLMMGAGKIL